ncbi:MAG: histidine kinase [Bryobacteraceae bacterium]
MNHGTDIGPAGGSAASFPMLIQCSEAGHVLWMSPTARAALGEARNLTDTVVSASERPCDRPAQSHGICLSFIYGAADGLLLSAQLLRREEETRQESALQGLEGEILSRFFRLQQTASKLVAQARQRQAGGGRAVIELIENERARLGRELHTGVGQLLVSILRQAEMAQAQLLGTGSAVSETFGRISTGASEALALVRSMSARLHPPEWQRLTLEAALEQLCQISGIPQRYQAELELATLPVQPEPVIKTLFYRAAQEAISNIDQHAHASRLRLALNASAEKIELTVWDNGPGIDTAALAAAPARIATGLGLRSIREQAAAVGGKMMLQSGPLGTKLVISAPFAVPA